MTDAAPSRPRQSRLEAWYERWAFPPPKTPRGTPARPFPASTPFVRGVNLPWLTYGCDFGASAWTPAGGLSAPATRDALRAHLAAQADAGFDVVRWFVFCDGRAGISLSPDGRPGGLDPWVERDFDVALVELQRAGLRAIFVLFDFLLAAPRRILHGVAMGGHADWIARADARGALLDNVVGPLASLYGHDAPIAAWDVLNEPEWIAPGAAREFLSAAARRLHESSPFPVTVGLASAAGFPLVVDADLDLYQVHWYDGHELRHPLSTPVSHFELDRPVLLGEYPTSGSRRTAAEIVDTAKRAGYAGAFAWSALAADAASGLQRAASG